MTKDFAKNRQSSHRATTNKSATKSRQEEDLPSSSFKPFALGTIFGVILCLGVQWFLSLDPVDSSQDSIADVLEPEVITGPVLDFYTRLREVEVMVPDDGIDIVSQNLLYLLQAGSFRNAQDADSMRAQLILLNMVAEISKFNHNGEIWHRVIVGPFSDRSSMAKARTTLLENGIESLLLTQPAE